MISQEKETQTKYQHPNLELPQPRHGDLVVASRHLHLGQWLFLLRAVAQRRAVAQAGTTFCTHFSSQIGALLSLLSLLFLFLFFFGCYFIFPGAKFGFQNKCWFPLPLFGCRFWSHFRSMLADLGSCAQVRWICQGTPAGHTISLFHVGFIFSWDIWNTCAFLCSWYVKSQLLRLVRRGWTTPIPQAPVILDPAYREERSRMRIQKLHQIQKFHFRNNLVEFSREGFFLLYI